MDTKSTGTPYEPEWEPECVLARLANLPGTTPDPKSVEQFKRDYSNLLGSQKPSQLAVAVEEFRRVYGELCPGMGVSEYIGYAKILQLAWQAKTRADKECISQGITAIFERARLPQRPAPAERGGESYWGGLPSLAPLDDDPRLRPGIIADFETGKTRVRSRTQLDRLMVALLEYRNKLAVCEREGCEHPYFVKTHPRYRYCSPPCAYAVRSEGKREWWKENRGKTSKQKKEPKQTRAGRARRSERQTRP